MSRSRNRVDVFWLGSVPYGQAWDLQRNLVERVARGEAPDTLLLLEHPHVYTLGRRGTMDHVLWNEAERAQRRVELVECDRGGDVTYHGPGQLVGYPILDLARHGADILMYLRRLEASLVSLLAAKGLQGATVPGLTGVWSGEAKVAAIGVRLTDRVVSHGFALNVTTDLEYFEGIVPCGISDKAVTSLKELGVAPMTTAAAALEYVPHFGQEFDVEVVWSKESLAWNVMPSDEPSRGRRLPILSA